LPLKNANSIKGKGQTRKRKEKKAKNAQKMTMTVLVQYIRESNLQDKLKCNTSCVVRRMYVIFIFGSTPNIENNDTQLDSHVRYIVNLFLYFVSVAVY
jgi:hypothetical protein